MSQLKPRDFKQDDLAQFFFVSSDLMCLAGDDGYFKRVNSAFVKTLGYSEEELLSRPYAEFVHPDDLAKTNREAGQLARGVPTVTFENRYICKDGSIRWLSWKCTPHQGILFGTARDITLEKETGEALRRSEQKLQMVLEAAPISFLVVNADGTIELSAGRGLKKAGRLPNQNRGQNFFSLYKSRSDLVQPVRDALAGETSYARFDFEGNSYEATYSPVIDDFGVIQQVVAVANEVTEQRKAEEEIHYRQIADTLPEIVWTFDPSGNPRYCNRRWRDFLQHSDDAFKFQDLLDVLHPDEVNDWSRDWQSSLSTGQTFESESRFWDRKTQVHRWFLCRIVCVRLGGGEIQRWIGTATDIHAQKVADVSMRRMAAVMASSTDAIMVRDLHGTITNWNKGAELMFGYSAEEIVGQSILKLLPTHLHAEEVFVLEKVLSGSSVDHYETERVRKNGASIFVSLSVAPVTDTAGRVVGAAKIARDITYERRAKADLAASEARFRKLADSMPQIVWTAGPDGHPDYYNERWYEFTDFQKGAILHTTEWISVVHPDDRPHSLKVWTEALRTGTPYEAEYRLLNRKDRTYRWHLGRALPVRNEAGEIKKWIGTYTDIHAQKVSESALETKRAELAGIIDNSPAIIMVKDTAGRYLLVNKVYEDIFGRDRAFMMGKTDYDFWPAEIADRFRDHEQHVMSSRNVHHQEMTVPINGVLQEYLVVKFPIVNTQGEVNEIGAIVTDITAKKRFETEKTELEVKERAATEASRLKSEFLAIMSHEIRTPLNGIVGMSNLLAETELNSIQNEYVETVVQSSEHLLSIVNDILDLAKIEANRLELELSEFHLHTLVHNLYRSFFHSARQKKLRLKLDIESKTDLTLKGDFVRVRQILFNLVQNAIKYTDRGEVRLGVSRVSKEGTYATIKFEISDTGIGIPEDDLKQIFNPFTQGDNSSTRKHGGTGLGLSICKQLSDLMNGSLRVRSELGQGSVFTFEAAFQDCSGQGKAFPRDRKSQSKKARSVYRVLVAEDNRTNQMVITRILESFGYSAVVVASGKQALKAFRTEPFDLIILDCHMPEMDGFTAAEKIRKKDKKTPIIALTADVLKGTKERCLKSGMDAYLPKPIQVDELRLLVDQVVLKKGDLRPRSTEKKSLHAVDLRALKKLQLLNKPGTPDFAEELVTDFLRKTPDRLSALEKAIRAKELQEAFKQAHSLKSVAAAVGAVKLERRLALIEASAHQGSEIGCRKGISKIAAIYTNTKQELENFFSLRASS